MPLSGLPDIQNLRTLSSNLSISPRMVYRLCRLTRKFYRHRTLIKKNGGVRHIYCPSRKLKGVQAWILRNILEKVEVSQAASAYVPKRGPLYNVEPHLGNKFFLCLDLKDFFPSIPYSYVYTVFRSLGYQPHPAHLLTALCTLRGKLPQGAVTSPALSNVVCTRLDHRIGKYAGNHDVEYTRYADDITLSAPEPRVLSECKAMIIRIIEDEGYSVNKKKTRRLGPRRRRLVTGLVISNTSIGIGRRRKRMLRAKLYHLATDTSLTSSERKALERELQGWMAHLGSVDKVALDQLTRYSESLSLASAEAAAAAPRVRRTKRDV